MTDEFSMNFDVNKTIREATERIAEQAESALRDAVAAELRRQGWAVVPPHESRTQTDNEKLIEEAAERAYPDTEWSQKATMIAFRDAFARGWREAEKAHTPSDDEGTSEQQEEQRHGDRSADHEEQQADDLAATGTLSVGGSHASSMPQATSDGKRVIPHTPTDDEKIQWRPVVGFTEGVGSMSSELEREALDYLDEMNEAGRIEYDDYRNLHDLISGAVEPAREMFPGTLAALDDLTTLPKKGQER